MRTRFAEYWEHKRKSVWARMSFWSKVYWGLGFAGAGLVAYNRVDWDGSKAAAEQVRAHVELAIFYNHLLGYHAYPHIA
jgi:hypothetical protein